MLNNEFLLESSVVLGLYATRVLIEDCRRHIVSHLPTHTWSRCEYCGFPLIVADDYGVMSFSKFTRFSFEACDSCYWREF